MSNNQTNPEIPTMRENSMEINLIEKAKTSDFICDFRFQNELPDPSAKTKLVSLNRDPDRYCKYQTTSLEKDCMKCPSELDLELKLGNPHELLDLNAFSRPKGERIPLDQEDEELLRDDDDDVPMEAMMTDGVTRTCDKCLSQLTNLSLYGESGCGHIKDLDIGEWNKQDVKTSFEVAEGLSVDKVTPQVKPIRPVPMRPYVDWYEKHFGDANLGNDPVAEEIYMKGNASENHQQEWQLGKEEMHDQNENVASRWKFVDYFHPLQIKFCLRKMDREEASRTEHRGVSETVIPEVALELKDEGDLVATKDIAGTSTSGGASVDAGTGQLGKITRDIKGDEQTEDYMSE